MSDRIAEMFARTRAEGRPAVIPFLPAGWPEPDDTVRLVEAAIEGGADAVEIGLPFSDPLGDGPVNQQAYQEAIRGGCNTETALSAVAELRARGVRAPLLVMGYFNPVLAYGVTRFVQAAARAGVDGLIIVDLPPQEAAELEIPAREAGLHMVYLLAPTSTDDRIRLVAEHASGFIYCVSVVGITGERRELSAELPEFIARVRARTDLPLAVGFGISAREHVQAVGALADAAIVGSAFVRTIAEATAQQRPEAVRAFVEEITGHEPAVRS
ncbi:MAG: tryptophan synthase subunit alpha [Dehalococcoidia bacterium]